ncbi:hypothetical protein O3P69_002774 [Scylla paramamosain]|uniref:Uncharacterized protein n=1 Tax=Scylla paramamosain TaxID=85552 RepID=A0AAW0UM70_SCYPA
MSCRMMALQQQPVEGMSGREETMLSKTASPLRSRCKVEDSRIMGKEEMMDLRNQLQIEVESIARWKASTEVKAKNMERDIQEKQSIIDDLRSNLMELQLHSEHLSQSLFQERQERELVSAKVGHTRQLFLTLQEQHEQLTESEKTQLCSELDEVRDSLFKAEEQLRLENEKLTEQITRADEELKLEHEQLVERTKEFQEAAEKIQYLKKVNDTLEGAKSELTERVTALASHKQELEEEINYKENFIQTLQSAQERSLIEIKELNGRVSDVCSQLSIVENYKESLEQERNMLAEKLQSTKKKLSKKKNLLEQFKEQVTTLESDLEAKKTALMHLEEENKNKEEISHNLEVSLNEINKSNIICNEALQEMAQKISLTENSDLKAKVQECEDLSTTIKELNEEIKTIEKECEVKIKNEEISSLTAKIEIMTRELEQVKEEASSAIKEKLHIKLESDNKVKEMSDLLDTYKTDKEAKLKVADEELKKSQSQITQLVQERAMKNEVEKILIPPSVSPSIRTPSPGSYLDTMNTFAKPSIPPAPRTIIKPEADKVQGKPVVSILKTRRRTLLPPEFQKRVVFKPLTHIKDYTSGDSSSDACALEAADSDEPFEEIKRAIRYPGIRQEKVPRANVAPFIPETNIPQKTPLPLNEHNMNNKMPAAKKAKRKSKPPAKLKEFLCEDNIEKEHEPRRSRRIPKISERLKRYMDDKGGMVKEQDGGQMSSQAKKEPQVISDELKDIDEKDILNILKWLEEEERQRKEHRRKVLESLRETHRTNIALYSHMLNVLQAVTASG